MFHFVNNSLTGQGSSSEWDHLGRLDGVVRQSSTDAADGSTTTTTRASASASVSASARAVGDVSGGGSRASPSALAHTGASPSPLAGPSPGPAANARTAMTEMDNEILAAFRGGALWQGGRGRGRGRGVTPL